MVDFGYSIAYDPEQGISDFVGTPLYAAPEVLKRRNKYNEKCDIWSLGVVAYTMLSGHTPFPRANRQRMYERIIDAQFHFDAPVWDFVTKEAKGFIASCLQSDPAKRPST